MGGPPPGGPPIYGQPGSPPGYPSPGYGGQDPNAQRRDAEGVIRGLFDFSFSTFITSKVVRFLYILYLLCVALGFLFGMASGLMALFAGGASDRAMSGFGGAPGGGMGGLGVFIGLLQLFVTPIASAIALIYGRVICECIVVFFRVAEHVTEIDRKTRG